MISFTSNKCPWQYSVRIVHDLRQLDKRHVCAIALPRAMWANTIDFITLAGINIEPCLERHWSFAHFTHFSMPFTCRLIIKDVNMGIEKLPKCWKICLCIYHFGQLCWKNEHMELWLQRIILLSIRSTRGSINGLLSVVNEKQGSGHIFLNLWWWKWHVTLAISNPFLRLRSAHYVIVNSGINVSEDAGCGCVRNEREDEISFNPV